MTIPAGKQDDSVFVHAQPVTGAARTITIHATYAGATVSAPVQVLPAPSELKDVVSDGDTGGPINGATVLIDGSTATSSWCDPQKQKTAADSVKAAEAAGVKVVGHHYTDIVTTAMDGKFIGSKYNANYRVGLQTGTNPFVQSP